MKSSTGVNRRERKVVDRDDARIPFYPLCRHRHDHRGGCYTWYPCPSFPSHVRHAGESLVGQAYQELWRCRRSRVAFNCLTVGGGRLVAVHGPDTIMRTVGP